MQGFFLSSSLALSIYAVTALASDVRQPWEVAQVASLRALDASPPTVHTSINEHSDKFSFNNAVGSGMVWGMRPMRRPLCLNDKCHGN